MELIDFAVVALEEFCVFTRIWFVAEVINFCLLQLFLVVLLSNTVAYLLP